jgi:predicted nucleic acid-binding protein
MLTIGEIRKGVETVRARDPEKARALETWLQAIVQAFGPRILGIDAAVAESWGRIAAIRSVPVVDALLAATASMHGLVLVTRNATDVAGLGVRILNPFEPFAT